MQSVHHGFKQFLAVVLSASLVFSLAPPPSRAATKTTPDASILWHPPQPLRSRQAKTLGVNSASLAINPVVGNSLEVPGVAAQHSETKTAVPVGASDPTKLRRRKIEAKSIVKRSPFGNAKIPGARPLAFIENKGQFN